jgi:hypothetical protein
VVTEIAVFLLVATVYGVVVDGVAGVFWGFLACLGLLPYRLAMMRIVRDRGRHEALLQPLRVVVNASPASS